MKNRPLNLTELVMVRCLQFSSDELRIVYACRPYLLTYYVCRVKWFQTTDGRMARVELQWSSRRYKLRALLVERHLPVIVRTVNSYNGLNGIDQLVAGQVRRQLHCSISRILNLCVRHGHRATSLAWLDRIGSGRVGSYRITGKWLAAWRNGSVVRRVNEVTLRWVWLVMEWVTVFGGISCNQAN